jgi:hypothetical protein
MIRLPRTVRAMTWTWAIALSLAAVCALIALEGGALLVGGANLLRPTARRTSFVDFVWSDQQRLGVAMYWSAATDPKVGVSYSAALIAPDNPEPVLAGVWRDLAPRCALLAGPHEKLIVACEDGRLCAFETIAPDASRLVIGRHPEGEPEALACTADGTILFSKGTNYLCAWDVIEQCLLWPANAKGILSITVHPQRLVLLCGRSDGSVEERDAQSGAGLRKFAAQEGPITSLVICPDGREAVSMRAVNELALWQLDTGQRLWSAPLLAATPKSLSVSRDGRWVTVATLSGGSYQILRFDAASGAAEPLPVSHARTILGTLFTRNGQLFTWGDDGMLRLCNVDPVYEVAQWSPGEADR